MTPSYPEGPSDVRRPGAARTRLSLTHRASTGALVWRALPAERREPSSGRTRGRVDSRRSVPHRDASVTSSAPPPRGWKRRVGAIDSDSPSTWFATQDVSLRTPASSSGRSPRRQRAPRAPEGVWRRRPGAPPKWTSQDSLRRSCTGSSRLGSPDPERSARLHELPARMSMMDGLASPPKPPRRPRQAAAPLSRTGGRGRRPPSSLASQGHRALPPGVTETKSSKQVDSPSSGLCSTIASDTRPRGLRPRASRCSRGFHLSRATTTQAPTLLPPPPGGLPSEEVQPGLVGRRNIPHAVMSDRAGGHDSELPSSLASPRRPLPEGSALCAASILDFQNHLWHRAGL